MTEIIIATKNKHKVSEMSELLGGFADKICFKSLDDIGFDEEIAENGSTFEENALIKARTVCKKTGKISLADDSGLCVDALLGEPGIYSARYAAKDGKNSQDDKNIEKLLENLKHIPSGERTARFVCAIALVLPDGREYTVKGISEGHITSERRGSGGFGYDSVFFCPKFSKTFAQMTAEEKNAISHRNAAVKQIEKIIEELIRREEI